MTGLRQAISWILLLLVVLGAVAVLVRATGFVVPDVPTAIVAGAFTLGLTHLFRRLGEIQAEQRQRKIDAYSGFMNLIFSDVVAPIHQRLASGSNPKADSVDITEQLFKVSAQIGLWAKNDVLKEYTALLEHFIAGANAERPDIVFERVSEVILIFRKDLGYPRGTLSPRDLYPLFGVPRTLGQTASAPEVANPETSPGTVSK